MWHQLMPCQAQVLLLLLLLPLRLACSQLQQQACGHQLLLGQTCWLLLQMLAVTHCPFCFWAPHSCQLLAQQPQQHQQRQVVLPE